MNRERHWIAALSAAAITAALLAIVQWKVRTPMLIAERFVTGAGWIEIVALSVYAAWITNHILDIRRSSVWRRRLWAIFSTVFFGQLLLGLAGFEKFLMTGKLHIPVPAMIVGGPLYRGHGLFMPILFTITVVLVGPAWCSFLCYIGAWDSGFAHRTKRPQALPGWRKHVRAVLLAGVIGTAIGLNLAGVNAAFAAAAGIAFGVVGVVVMAVASRRTGSMVHCVAYCPMGLLATTLGKVSPFRMRILPQCDQCGACTKVCRYDALSAEDIRRRRPGWSCTLCGDCQRACRDRFIEYRFPGLSSGQARTVFLVLVVALHAVFLGVARI